MSLKSYKCPTCGKRCGNAGAYKRHMKSHKRPEPKSASMLRYVKLAPVKAVPKKPDIELKPVKAVRQLKLRKDPPRTVVSNPAPPRGPRRPRRSQQMPIDQGPFVAPAELVAPDLDKKSPHFRVAHVRHFRKLKANFPMLDKKMYHEANESSLGVKLRRFQAWFQQYEEDVITMKRAKPLVKKERRHNKVEFQAARAHYTPKEKANTTETTATKKATSDSSCCPKATS